MSDLFCLRRLIRASCAFVAPLSFELHLTFGRDTPLSCAFDTGTEKTAVKTDLVSRAERIPARQPQQTLPCEKMRTHRPLPSKQVMNKKFDQKEESTIFVLLGFPRLVKKNLSFHHEFFLQSFCLLACARNFFRICPDQCACSLRHKTAVTVISCKNPRLAPWMGEKKRPKARMGFVERTGS